MAREGYQVGMTGGEGWKSVSGFGFLGFLKDFWGILSFFLIFKGCHWFWLGLVGLRSLEKVEMLLFEEKLHANSFVLMEWSWSLGVG